MASVTPPKGVAATAQELGLNLFTWETRDAKYWQSKVCPYAAEVHDVCEGLQEAQEDEQYQFNQGKKAN
jgi:hypothetical protein